MMDVDRRTDDIGQMQMTGCAAHQAFQIDEQYLVD
jgi:hypothetical protein